MIKNLPLQWSRWLTAALCLALFPAAQAMSPSSKVTSTTIAEVWSGHPVGFALMTAGDTQYAGYYDAERNMVIASRKLDSDQWTKQILPTKIAWDSHNYITFALDRAGQLHIFGNMHACPLIYFRTEKPGDVTSIKQIAKMTGEREQSVTYPQFIKGNDGEMIFTYRDGSSGKGDTIYNKYDEKTQTWTRLMDKALFEGHGHMNAYPAGPVHGPDGYWHMAWVWRNTPAAETNHDLSYIRSKDLVHWETVDGKPLTLPISLETPGVIVDPVPVNGGIINGAANLGFDDKNQIVITYHKFDESGATQIYATRFENGKWAPRQLTHWTYRWEPKGGGSIPFDVGLSGIRHDAKLGYFINLRNKQHESGTWKIDPKTLQLGERVPNDLVPDQMPAEVGKRLTTEDPRLSVKTTKDSGKAPKGVTYLLKWETLGLNRDQPQSPVPAPSKLELLKITDADAAK